ncbi:MAG: hypothetical protein COC06_12230 [Bacteroidales bacterium]|nr:MAG: hypothetical protein COC06_12230 [Bacteroidales bacterium]
MYCKECQSKLDEQAEFCKECGTPTLSNNKVEVSESNGTEIEEAEEKNSSVEPEVSISAQSKVIKRHNIFHNSNEILIDSLGSGFIQSLVLNREFNKSILFLSDKRIYQKGKIFEKDSLGKLTYFNGEKFMELREVTGAYFSITNETGIGMRAFFLIIFGLLGIFFLVVAEREIGRKLTPIIAGISVFLIVFGLIRLIQFQLKKHKYLTIESSGGIMTTNCSWYTRKSIRRFMRNISIQKDKLISQ